MAKAPRSWEWAIGRSETPVHSLTLLSGRRVGHLANLLRNRPDGWAGVPFAKLIDDSLSAAITDLRRRFGNDPSAWRWGRIRPLALKHPVGRSRWLAPVFNLPPIPCAGDTNTVFQTGADPRDPAGAPSRMPLDAHDARRGKLGRKFVRPARRPVRESAVPPLRRPTPSLGPRRGDNHPLVPRRRQAGVGLDPETAPRVRQARYRLYRTPPAAGRSGLPRAGEVSADELAWRIVIAKCPPTTVTRYRNAANDFHKMPRPISLTPSSGV